MEECGTWSSGDDDQGVSCNGAIGPAPLPDADAGAPTAAPSLSDEAAEAPDAAAVADASSGRRGTLLPTAPMCFGLAIAIGVASLV